MKKITSLIIICCLVSLVACKTGKKSYPVLPEGSTDGSFIIESAPFVIGDDTFTADYGSIAVPENRSKTGSRLITLPFLRIRSGAKNPAEPIFAFSGGPGQSNMYRDWGSALVFLAERDFVLVGYRGVDGSSKLDCPEVIKALKTKNDPLSMESVKNIGNAWSMASLRFKEEGVDLDGYTMTECVEDNELVRSALGYGCINLISESYGTRVAYLYGLMHPESISRSAMISVNPPGHFVWKPDVTDAQLKYYSVLWSKNSEMSEKCPDLYGTMKNVLNDMPGKWLVFKINRGKVMVVTFALLFHRTTAIKVFDTYVAAENGDPGGLALMSLAYDFIIPSMITWGDLASKAVSADYDYTRDYFTDMAPSTGMPLGAPMSRILWGPLSYALWPVKMLPEEYRQLRETSVQTLMLSGSIDFSTPAEFAANELLPYLKNGRQIILSECGHVGDIWYADFENTNRILSSFYKTGLPDTSLNEYNPVAFYVKWGFPEIVKAIAAAILLLVVILTAVSIKVFRMVLNQYRARKRHYRDNII